MVSRKAAKMDHFLKICPVKERGAYWKVSNKYLEQYMSDLEIKIFELRTLTKSWWKSLARMDTGRAEP